MRFDMVAAEDAATIKQNSDVQIGKKVALSLQVKARLSDNLNPCKVLHRWKFDKETFPGLSNPGRFNLNIPASNVPSEGVFSICVCAFQKNGTVA